MQPAWLTSTLASDRLAGVDPALVAQAAADPDHLAHIRSAIKPPDPSDPRAAQKAFNLSDLFLQVSYRDGYGPDAAALARYMYETDPEHHGYTLAAVAERRPIEEFEADILHIAFEPRADTIGWKRSRYFASAIHVQRLALMVRQLPRPLPKGAPEFTVADVREVTCYHWTLRASYAQGDQAENIAKVAAILDEPEHKHRPGNDHDVENCRTIIWRLTELGGRQP